MMISYLEAREYFFGAFNLLDGRGRALIKLCLLWWCAFWNNLLLPIDVLFWWKLLWKKRLTRRYVFLLGYPDSGADKLCRFLSRHNSREFCTFTFQDMLFPCLCLRVLSRPLINLIDRLKLDEAWGWSEWQHQDDNSVLFGVHRWCDLTFLSRVMPWMLTSHQHFRKHTMHAEDQMALMECTEHVRFLKQCCLRQLAFTGANTLLLHGPGLTLRIKDLHREFYGAKYFVFSHDPLGRLGSIRRSLHLFHETLIRDGVSVLSAKNCCAAIYPVHLDIYRRLEAICQGQTGIETKANVDVVTRTEVDEQLPQVIGKIYKLIRLGDVPTDLVQKTREFPRWTENPPEYRELTTYGLPKTASSKDLNVLTSVTMGNMQAVANWRRQHNHSH